MDGVLIDSEPLHLIAYQQFLAGLGKVYEKGHNDQFLGRKDTEIAPLIISSFDLSISPEKLITGKDTILFRLIKETPEPMPGVLALLEASRALGLKIGLASSSKIKAIELIVTCLGIKDYFSTLTSGDEVEHGKPAPDIFTLAARRLDTEPHNCLVIEDSQNGVKAAKSAGMNCLAVPCEATRHQDHSQADLIVSNLLDLDLVSMLGYQTGATISDTL